jgi:serine/threonine protein kinase
MAIEVVPDGPTPDRLASLLAEDGATPERADLEDHPGGCEHCQQTLERLAVDTAVWSTWARRLKDEQVSWPSNPGSVAGEPDARPTVPGYELLGLLGRGGTGIVYKARQVALGRLVALKVIRAARQSDPEYCSRFRREAEVVARLQHPHIVQVYDYGEADGWTYISLELVEGGTLSGRPRKHTLPAREAAEVVEALARAVHHAHAAGVLHRDIKPANVLVTGDRRQEAGDRKDPSRSSSLSPASCLLSPVSCPLSPRSPSSAWPDTTTTRTSPAAGPSSAPPNTWPRSRPWRSTGGAPPRWTSTGWGPSSMRR